MNDLEMELRWHTRRGEGGDWAVVFRQILCGDGFFDPALGAPLALTPALSRRERGQELAPHALIPALP
jgi:hypothetical protein